jgi:LacI family transcriptional regulator, galactose operon repressor
MQKKRSVTIYDIANHLNISASTVSRALHDNPLISTDTRNKIKAVARKLKYHHNTIASSLRNSKTNCIGIVVPRINRHFFASAISGMQDKAQEYGYNVLIGQTSESVDREKSQLSAMLSSRVDGIIVSPTMYTKNFSHFDIFNNQNIPLLYFDRTPDHTRNRMVVGNDFEGGFMATEHLIQQGCRRIAHFCGELSSSIYMQRLEGYKYALLKHRQPVREELIIMHELTSESAIVAIDQLLQLKKIPDGLFSSNDTSGLIAIKYLQQKGIGVPKDIAIVGYGNDTACNLVSPMLTTIDQYGYELGKSAVEELLELIQISGRKIVKNKKVVIPVKLIVRESSLKKEIKKTIAVKMQKTA